MNKFRVVLTAALVFILACSNIFAADNPHIKATVDNAGVPAVKIYVENKFITMPDGSPYIENSRTMVPVRFVSEALKGDVTCNY